MRTGWWWQGAVALVMILASSALGQSVIIERNPAGHPGFKRQSPGVPWTVNDLACVTSATQISVGGACNALGGTMGLTADSGGTTTGAPVTLQGGTNGIDTVRSSNTITFNLDPTEVNDTTWGGGGEGEIDWPFAVTGTDPHLLASDFLIAANSPMQALRGDATITTPIHAFKTGKQICSGGTRDGLPCTVQGGHATLGCPSGGTCTASSWFLSAAAGATEFHGVDLSGTVTLDNSAQLSTGIIGFHDAIVYQNESGEDLDFASVTFGVREIPTFKCRGSGAACTFGGGAGTPEAFTASINFATEDGATLEVPLLYNFSAVGIVGSGVTVKTRYGFRGTDPGSLAGTIEKNYAFVGEKLTGTIETASAVFADALIYTPSSSLTVTSANKDNDDLIVIDEVNKQLTTDGSDYILGGTPTISDAVSGGKITKLCNIHATKTITLQDESVLTGSNLELKYPRRTLSRAHPCIEIMFDSTLGAWVDQDAAHSTDPGFIEDLGTAFPSHAITCGTNEHGKFGGNDEGVLEYCDHNNSSTPNATWIAKGNALGQALSVGTLTAKGDVVTRTSAIETRVAVGSDGQVLTADSTQAAGIKWASSTGAPTDASYLTLGSHAGLSDERGLVIGMGLIGIDAGLTYTTQLDYAGNLTTNPTGGAMGGNQCVFSSVGGILCEGATGGAGDANEILLAFPDPGSDKTVSVPLPSASSDTLALLGLDQTFTGTNKFTGIIQVPDYGSGFTPMTCSSGDQGRVVVIDEGPIMFCDGNGTPSTRYAALGNFIGQAVQTIAIQNGANQTVTGAVGTVSMDTTADQVVYQGASTTRVLSPVGRACYTRENLAAGDDNFPFWIADAAVAVTSVGCLCHGTCSTLATFTLEDVGGNAMTITGTNPTCATTGTVTYAAVTAGNALIAGEGIAFDVTNSPTANDEYTVCVTYTTTRV